MKHFLKEQYGKLLCLKSPPVEASAVKSIMEQWERIVGYVGQERFSKGIYRCAGELEFFPSVPELENKIPAAEQEFNRCRMCRNSDGFIVETRPHPWKDGETHQVARKCKHV